MEHRVVLGGQFGEQLLVVRNVNGGGGGQLSPVLHVAEDVLGAGLQTVFISVAAEGHIQGHHGDLIALQQLRGQVAGAGGGDFDGHWDDLRLCKNLFPVWFKGLYHLER